MQLNIYKTNTLHGKKPVEEKKRKEDDHHEHNFIITKKLF